MFALIVEGSVTMPFDTSLRAWNTIISDRARVVAESQFESQFGECRINDLNAIHGPSYAGLGQSAWIVCLLTHIGATGLHVLTAIFCCCPPSNVNRDSEHV